MSKDWYRDHHLSPEESNDEDYRDWAHEAGAYIDVCGNVVWPDLAVRASLSRTDTEETTT